MPTPIRISSQRDTALEDLLDDRLYEFNARATGYDDGELLSASVEEATGQTIAGVTGHTWGGCCKVTRLWVHESKRGTGIGTALMQAVETEAMRRGCEQIVLSTHSFQAPGFYEGLGFTRVAAVHGDPKDHADLFYVKRLAT